MSLQTIPSPNPPPAGACRLALGQILVEPGAPDRNVRRAEHVIAEAAARSSHIVLLPEVMDCGWTHPSAEAWAGSIPGGRTCERLREAAKAHHVFVCAGLAERADGRLFNAAVLFSPAGDLLLHHRKIHELDFAQQLYARGDRLGVADSAWGRIGLMICADGFVEGLAIGHTLAEMGASLILSPCAWAVPADHDNAAEPYGQLWVDSYGPVARRHGVIVAGCSNVGLIPAGEWAGRQCIGCSLVVGASGEILAKGRYGVAAEELIITDITTGRQPTPPLR